MALLAGMAHSRQAHVLAMLLALAGLHLGSEAYSQDGKISESERREKIGKGGEKTTREPLPVFFSQAQASEGRTAYREHCASCHGPKLDGIDLAPSLVGTRFDQSWRGKPAEILSFHVRRMPPEAIAEPGSMSDEMHTSILAYILRSNGFAAGDVDLPSDLGALGDLIIPRLDGAEYDPDAPVIASAEQSELLERLPSVTDEMLNNPSPSDWLHWGRTYDMHNFSPLTEINRENVSSLKPAWRVSLRNGTCNPAPLVYQGVMYLCTFPDTVLAMDASNGMVLWRYRHEGRLRSSNKTGIALHGDKVLVPTSDLHVLALEAKTGKRIWDHAIAHDQDGLDLRSAPLVAGDKVIQGVMGILVPKGGFIVALDINTGTESWRFNTIARPGEPGGNTWNDLPLEKRSGGSVWHQGSYDADLNLVYFGTAPTYDTGPLLHAVDKEGVNNDALFTNTTLAIDPDTGRLVWYYQHMANDQWDLDWVFERQIVNLRINGETRKVVFTVGKLGILDALDAATGEYLFSIDMGLQNVVASIDPKTGAKTINPDAVPSLTESHLLGPNLYGARNWPPLAYNPQKRRLYLPLTRGSMLFGPMRPQRGGLLSSGVSLDMLPHPDNDGNWAHLLAVDLEDRELSWEYRQATPLVSGLLATAGGLVFSGDLSRSIKAFDEDSGDLLWQAQLDDNPSSTIIAYNIGGKQYIAVVVGLTADHVEDWEGLYRHFAPSLGMPSDDSLKGGAAIWAFTL